MDTAGRILLYSGLVVAAAGAISLLWPLRFAGIRSRKAALLAIAAASAMLTAGVFLPVSRTIVARPFFPIDQILPVYQLREAHEIRVAAPPERAYAAICPEEIRLYRALTWLRRPHRISVSVVVVDRVESNPTPN